MTTNQRPDEIGRLGTALMSQRKALAEQLEEVEKLQNEGEISQDLREKLEDIEKEYENLAGESARAFLPKQKAPNVEDSLSSLHVLEGRSGKRSISPSKSESQTTGSPTKISVPNRKSRVPHRNRNEDVEFAAEISQSLISQVRNLQSLLVERDEELRDLKIDKTSLEISSESLHKRLKALDESEHRYKEENWNLETRIQELSSQQLEAKDREKKLALSLNAEKENKLLVQNKLDEVELAYGKLIEDHKDSVKIHSIELGISEKAVQRGEAERAMLQLKIDDLTRQNLELVEKNKEPNEIKERLELEMEEYEQRVDSLQKSEDRYKTEILELLEDLDFVNAKLRDLEKKLAQSDMNIQLEKDELLRAQEELNKVKERNFSLVREQKALFVAFGESIQRSEQLLT